MVNLVNNEYVSDSLVAIYSGEWPRDLRPWEAGAEDCIGILFSILCHKDAFLNLTVKKIPFAVLSKCEWGHDDYSLNVANLPKALPPPDQPPGDAERPLTPKQARRRAAQSTLFAADGNGGVE
jgi:hypothetical protein